MVHILIVEDDADLRQVVCRHLEMHGFQATGCPDPAAAYDMLYARKIDLIISDIMMPGTDGFEFAQTIREENDSIPILFVTAREDFSAKERGYRIGIDDYMVKPVDLDELLLRISALLRRANIASEKKLTLGSLVIDESAMTVTVNGDPVSLTLREFQILFKLLSNPNRAFTRSQLVDEFSGLESESGLRTVDVFIANLRSKFAHCADFKIVTVRGLGYKAVVS